MCAICLDYECGNEVKRRKNLFALLKFVVYVCFGERMPTDKTSEIHLDSSKTQRNLRS